MGLVCAGAGWVSRKCLLVYGSQVKGRIKATHAAGRIRKACLHKFILEVDDN